MKNVLVPNAGQYTITRHLPKTGQTAVYSPGPDFGCDGFYQKGWWRGRDATNNRVRWIQRTIVGDDIVVDRATGLMWPENWTGAGGNGGAALAWQIAIMWANVLNFAGFTDWRLPNINEIHSLIEHGGAAPFVYQPPFLNVPLWEYWSSTSYAANPLTQAYIQKVTSGTISYVNKPLTRLVVAVRDSVL